MPNLCSQGLISQLRQSGTGRLAYPLRQSYADEPAGYKAARNQRAPA